MWVTAYYAGWFWDQSDPNLLDMTTMTHLVFGRIAPGAGSLGGAAGTVVEGAGTAHTATAAWTGGENIEQALIDKAHGLGKKALVMLGGAGDGGGFIASTANSTIQNTFITNLLDYAIAHDYDGIDVDWEDSLDNTTQQNQFIGFLTALRAAAALRSRYQGATPFLMTVPGYCLNNNIDLVGGAAAAWRATAANLCDQYNLMSYGMTFNYGGWSTWLFAPLFGASSTYPMDIDSSMNAYIAAGVPASKLGVGIGFYGANWAPRPAWAPNTTYSTNAYVTNGVNAYQCTTGGMSASSGGPTGTGTGIVDNVARWSYVGFLGPRQPIAALQSLNSSDLEYDYYHLQAYLAGIPANGSIIWDSVSQSNYMQFPNGYTPPAQLGRTTYSKAGYISYEDAASIAAKGTWAKSKDIGGAIVWVTNYGITNLTTGANPLMAAVKTAFLEGTQVAGGNVSGTWTAAGSPYKVNGNITIPSGSRLTINPGVTVEFQGYYKMVAAGRLTAQGTAGNKILFTNAARSNATGWAGLRLPASSSLVGGQGDFIEHCIIEYGVKNGATGAGPEGPYSETGGGGLFIDSRTAFTFDNNEVRYCKANEWGGGMLYISPVVARTFTGNNFHHNATTTTGKEGYGGGLTILHAMFSTAVTIRNGEFRYNTCPAGTNKGGGISIYDTTATFDSIIMSNNSPLNYYAEEPARLTVINTPAPDVLPLTINADPPSGGTIRLWGNRPALSTVGVYKVT